MAQSTSHWAKKVGSTLQIPRTLSTYQRDSVCQYWLKPRPIVSLGDFASTDLRRRGEELLVEPAGTLSLGRSLSIDGVRVKNVRYTLDQSEGLPVFRSRMRVFSRSLNCVLLQKRGKDMVHFQSTLQSTGVVKRYEGLVSVLRPKCVKMFHLPFVRRFATLSNTATTASRRQVAMLGSSPGDWV